MLRYIAKHKSEFSFALALSAILMFVISFLIIDPLDDEVTSSIPTWFWFAIPCAILFSLLGAFLFIAIKKWFGPNFGPHLFEMQLYERANRLRKEAQIVLAFIFILVIGSAVVFFKASSFAHDDACKLLNLALTSNLVDKSGPKCPSIQDLQQLKAQLSIASSSATSPTDKKNPQERSESENLMNKVNADPIYEYFLKLTWLYFGLATAIRVGDIAVASFLTFMLVRIYRYNLRLSAFYYSRADAVVLSSDPRFKKVKTEALPAIFDANFDFGKDHPSLVADFAGLIRALHPPRRADVEDHTTRPSRGQSKPSNKSA